MSCVITGPGYSMQHLVGAYSWDSISSGGAVVDVGGSYGGAAFALARAFPSLHFIVQELPEIVKGCKEDLALDVKFMAHDLFKPQPILGAEVYLFRGILHNWTNQYCLRILRALVPALKKVSRVLVMEMVLPSPEVLPNGMDRKIRIWQ